MTSFVQIALKFPAQRPLRLKHLFPCSFRRSELVYAGLGFDVFDARHVRKTGNGPYLTLTSPRQVSPNEVAGARKLMAMRHLVAEFGPPHSRHGDYRLRLKQVSLRDFGIQAALMRSMIETMKIAQHMPSTRTTPSRHTKADFDRTIALMEEMQRFELKELAFGKQELEEAIRRVTKGENELADFPRGGEFYGDDVAGQLINEHIADVTRKGGKVSFESPIMNDMHALQVADNMALIIPPKPLPRPRKAAVPLSLETLLP